MIHIKQIVATFFMFLIVLSCVCVGTSLKTIAASSVSSENQVAVMQENQEPIFPGGEVPASPFPSAIQVPTMPEFHPTNNEASICEQTPGCNWVNGNCVCPTVNPESESYMSCLQSGGSVTTQMCCKSTSDFPNKCKIGPCGCSPDNSKETTVCDCGEGKCFDGTSCVDIRNDISSGYKFVVQVTDSSGYMVEGAEVTVDGTFRGMTDSKGELVVQLSDGQHSATASKADLGTGTWSGSLDHNADKGFAVTLSRDPKIECEINPGCVWVNGKCQCPDAKDLIIQGKVTKTHWSGPNSNDNFIIIEVIAVQPESAITYEYSPGSTIEVRADQYATLHDCVEGRCYEFPGVWTNGALWLFKDRGDYPKGIDCSGESLTPTCPPGYTGNCKCIKDEVWKENQKEDCSLGWKITETCKNRGPDWSCENCQCVKEQKPTGIRIVPECSYLSGNDIEGKPANWRSSINAYPTPGPAIYILPQTITADVCYEHDFGSKIVTSNKGFQATLEVWNGEYKPGRAVRDMSLKTSPSCFGGCTSNSIGRELHVRLPLDAKKGSYDARIRLYYSINYEGDRNHPDSLGWKLADEEIIYNAFRIEDENETKCQDIKFQGEVIEARPFCWDASYGGGCYPTWEIQMSTPIDDPKLNKNIIHVIQGIYWPRSSSGPQLAKGYIGKDITKGDKVEVYGCYDPEEPSVSLSEKKYYYIKKLSLSQEYQRPAQSEYPQPTQIASGYEATSYQLPGGNLSYWRFDRDFEGWGRTGSVAPWHAMESGIYWADNWGGAQGVVAIDACETKDIHASGGIKRVITLPPSAKKLMVNVIKHEFDGGIRFLVTDSEGSHTIGEEILSGKTAKSFSYDISSWAGKTVTLEIRAFGAGTQTASGCGSEGKCCGEYIGVDRIEVS